MSGAIPVVHAKSETRRPISPKRRQWFQLIGNNSGWVKPHHGPKSAGAIRSKIRRHDTYSPWLTRMPTFILRSARPQSPSGLYLVISNLSFTDFARPSKPGKSCRWPIPARARNSLAAGIATVGTSTFLRISGRSLKISSSGAILVP
jgi:hypothetical protein